LVRYGRLEKIEGRETNSFLAQDTPITVHVVTVGGPNAALEFFPSKVVANVGDMVQFQFKPKNHSVVQSTFDNPCAPISLHSNVTGVFSGYQPVAADAEMTSTYTIMVTDKKPMWLYCSQGKHCQSGMSMVINEKYVYPLNLVLS
jgi:plastocyanin